MNEDDRMQGVQDPDRGHHQSARRGDVRELTSDELLQGAAEILIRHGNDHYRLRSTSKGKLILTK